MDNLNNPKIISLYKIVPNKVNANRMGKDAFERLKLSIQKIGLLYPILVRKIGEDQYEIVDGEWRWRAFRDLGKQEIPAVEIEATDEEVAKIILTTTLKGKPDSPSQRALIESLTQENKSEILENSKTRKALNLDRSRWDRKMKFAHIPHEMAAAKAKEASEMDLFETGYVDDEHMAGRVAKRYEAFDDVIENLPIVLTVALSKEDYEYIVSRVEARQIPKESFSTAFIRLFKEIK